MNFALDVDWSKLPAPIDDGAADHLVGTRLPDLALTSTSGNAVNLSRLTGWTVLYAFPLTGRPDQPLPEGWEQIPGARGCTPQSCAFRERKALISSAGAALFGLSTQATPYQQEAVDRLALPFPLLSDEHRVLARALALPTFTVSGMTLLKRLTLIVKDGIIEHVFYPVFPPDRNADDVLAWLDTHRARHVSG
ncbi:peroxiredoxin [Paraburkholderia fungorum]|uniref:peroxiredoxin n=1 Tax=Paraburkholderia fungorum TaxID=134537 RepID=UPI00402B263A